MEIRKLSFPYQEYNSYYFYDLMSENLILDSLKSNLLEIKKRSLIFKFNTLI